MVMEAINERRPIFSSAFVQHRHSSATLLDFSPLHDDDDEEGSGTSMPPLHAPATVPFRWEQEPGKPRPGNRVASGPAPAKRCLDPPPCKTPKMPSARPGSIFDGVGRPKFSSSRFFGEGKHDPLVGAKKKKKGRGGLFGKLKSGGNSGNSFSSNSSCECDSDESCSGRERKLRRHNSYSDLSHHHHHRSHIWATLYGGLKQVVHWKSTRK